MIWRGVASGLPFVMQTKNGSVTRPDYAARAESHCSRCISRSFFAASSFRLRLVSSSSAKASHTSCSHCVRFGDEGPFPVIADKSVLELRVTIRSDGNVLLGLIRTLGLRRNFKSPFCCAAITFAQPTGVECAPTLSTKNSSPAFAPHEAGHFCIRRVELRHSRPAHLGVQFPTTLARTRAEAYPMC